MQAVLANLIPILQKQGVGSEAIGGAVLNIIKLVHRNHERTGLPSDGLFTHALIDDMQHLTVTGSRDSQEPTRYEFRVTYTDVSKMKDVANANINGLLPRRVCEPDCTSSTFRTQTSSGGTMTPHLGI